MQTFHMGLTTLEQEVNLSSLPIRGEIRRGFPEHCIAMGRLISREGIGSTAWP